MQPILIIRTGSAYEPIRKKYGDFDKLIIKNLPYISTAIEVVNAQHQPNLMLPDNYSGIIISGAHENVTDRAAWMLYLEIWIQELVKYDVPVLGICFGHQVIAHALGGKVDNNNDGGEFGVAEISIKNTNGFPLLNGLQAKTYGFCSHYQSVVELPKNAISLATSKSEKNQIVRYTNFMWGLQFHPEFNWAITKYYSKKNGKPNDSGDSYIHKITDISNKTILSNFIKICRNSI